MSNANPRLELIFSSQFRQRIALVGSRVDHPELCDRSGNPLPRQSSNSLTEFTGTAGMTSVALVFVEYACHHARQQHLLELIGPAGSLAASVHAILQKEVLWQSCFGFLKDGGLIEPFVRKAIQRIKRLDNFAIRLPCENDHYQYIAPRDIHITLDDRSLNADPDSISRLMARLLPPDKILWQRKLRPIGPVTRASLPQLDTAVGVAAVATAAGLKPLSVQTENDSAVSATLYAEIDTIRQPPSEYVTITASFRVPKESFDGQSLRDFLQLCEKLAAQPGAIPILIKVGSVHVAVVVPTKLPLSAIRDAAQRLDDEIRILQIFDLVIEEPDYLIRLIALITAATAVATPATLQGFTPAIGSGLGSPITVLIVEDDSTSREALAWLFTELGFYPIGVSDLAAARRVLDTKTPRILILDLMLPDGNGIDLLAEIRKARRPIIVAVVTGMTDLLKLRELMAWKPEAIFAKPLDVDEFDDWVVKQLSNFALPASRKSRKK